MENVAVGKARHWLTIFATLLVGEAAANAQEFAAPVDRNYTIDLFIGQAIGSSRIVGMGGAATAMAQGSPGMLANPASPAVRTMTSHDDWDWDWHLDSMSPSLGSDHDNNGITTNDSSFSPSATFGAVVQYKAWGFGFSATGLVIENSTADASGAETRIKTEALVNQLVVARHFLNGDLVVGAAARGVLLQVANVDDPDAAQTLLELGGVSLETGVIWKPSARRFRRSSPMKPASKPATRKTVPATCCQTKSKSLGKRVWASQDAKDRRPGTAPPKRAGSMRRPSYGMSILWSLARQSAEQASRLSANTSSNLPGANTASQYAEVSTTNGSLADFEFAAGATTSPADFEIHPAKILAAVYI